MYPKVTYPITSTPKHGCLGDNPSPEYRYREAAHRLQEIAAHRAHLVKEEQERHQEALDALRLAHKARLAGIAAYVQPLEDRYRQDRQQADEERRRYFEPAAFLFTGVTRVEQDCILLREVVRKHKRVIAEQASRYVGTWVQYDTDTGQPIRTWTAPMYTMRDEAPPWLRRTFRGYILPDEVEYSPLPTWVRVKVVGGRPLDDADEPCLAPLELSSLDTVTFL